MTSIAHSAPKRVTIRTVTWIFVGAGIAWFVVASPKTPVEFFDAANRDNSAREALPNRADYQAATGQTLVLQQMSVVRRDMERIALQYDMTHDPARVQKEKSSIIFGFYDTSPRTRDALKQNNDTYSALQMQFGELRAKLKASRSTAGASSNARDGTKEDQRLRSRRFQEEMDRTILRQFQAKVFWRKRG